MVGPAAKREAVADLCSVLQMIERRACTLVAADRKMIRYRSHRPPDIEQRNRLRDLANQRRRFGYRRLFILPPNQGEPSGINHIYRLYREKVLTVRKCKARRRAVGTRTPILIEAKVNARWSDSYLRRDPLFMSAVIVQSCQPTVARVITLNIVGLFRNRPKTRKLLKDQR